MQPLPTGIPQSVTTQQQLSEMRIRMWLKEELFHPNWWLLICLVIGLLLAWFLLLKREGLREALLYTTIITIFTMCINEYGEELILWHYPTDILPFFPPLTSVNLLLLPIAFSILYQRIHTWKKFLWASFLASAVTSCVIEPALSYGRLYEQINWEYFFSLPLFFLTAVLTKLVTDKLAAKSNREYRIQKRHP